MIDRATESDHFSIRAIGLFLHALRRGFGAGLVSVKASAYDLTMPSQAVRAKEIRQRYLDSMKKSPVSALLPGEIKAE